MKKLLSAMLLVAFIAGTLILSSCDEASNNHLTVKNVVDHFVACGLKVRSIQPLRSDIIKADEAVAVRIGDREVGIYKYNLDIDKQKTKIEKVSLDGHVYIVGLKYPALVNGSFLMIDYQKHPQKKAIIEAFKSFSK